MAEVIGVRFKDAGKVYYFDPCGLQVENGAKVVVETAHGIECGDVAMENREVSDSTIVQPLKKVLRLATKNDLKRLRDNIEKEKMHLRYVIKNCGAQAGNEACRRRVYIRWK